MESLTKFIEHFNGAFNSIIRYFSVKLLPSLFLPTFSFLFGIENSKILLALLILVIIDFITGIYSAYKAGEHIESRKAIKSAVKISMYGMMIAASHLTAFAIPFNAYIEEAVMAFLALTELISVIENVGKMGYAIPKKLLNKLQSLRDEEDSLVVTEKTHG